MSEVRYYIDYNNNYGNWGSGLFQKMRNTLIFESLYICKPMTSTLDFKTIYSVRSNSLSLKYQNFAP